MAAKKSKTSKHDNSNTEEVLFNFRNLKMDLWDWSFLWALILIILFYSSVLGAFVQVPGPIFGGDLYYHYGHMTHLKEGGSVFANSNYAGEYEYYPWLTHFAIVLLSYFPGISLFKSMIFFFPLLAIVASGLVLYSLGERMFDSKPLAFVLSFLWISSLEFNPVMTPSTAATALMVPLFFYFLVKADDWKSRIVAGVVLGLSGVQHFIVFLGAFVALGLLFFARIFNKHFKVSLDSVKISNKSKLFDTVKKQILFFLPIAIIGIIVAQLYFWPPLMIYHGHTPNPWHEYTASGVSSVKLSSVFSVATSMFRNFGSPARTTFSLLALVGLFAAFKTRKGGLAFLVWMVGLLGYAHPIVTKPLLGVSYGYYRFPSVFYPFAKTLFVAIGVYYLFLLCPKYFKQKNAQQGVILLVVLIAFAQFSSSLDSYKNDQWTSVGYGVSPTTQALFDLSEFVKKNTDVNDVFLTSHGESAFAFNAISGRKVVFMRRTHASPYVDVNERIADVAVMLYGKDSSKAKGLARKYNVKYYYEDFYSSSSRNQCLQAWNVLESNPAASYSCLRTSPEYAGYLATNGVEFKTVNVRLDPASSRAPIFEMIAIKPVEIDNFNFTTLHQAQAQGQLAAFVFGVLV